ncbi:MAG: MATE family efflux transporter [Treponema sp.]|jgi:putative MATE family efflux protein|nr:MATE family efflux transporter [Treponema sp.]
MKINEKIDLTNGPILRGLLHLAVPIIGSQVLQMLYNMTDMFWLGRLGSDEVAATAAVGLYLWLSVAFLLLGSVGASIGVSQAFGSGDIQKAKSYTNAALIISIIFGLIFTTIMILFRSQLVGIFNFREENVANYAKDYLHVVSLTIPLTYISAALGAVFTASGNSRTPFLCNITGTFINMVLDPILIFSLRLGVLGAAYATIIGQAVAFLMFVILIKTSKKRPFESIKLLTIPKLHDIVWIIKKTLPICAESFLFTFLVIISTRREAFFGADAVAISRVGSQIESLTWLVGGAFGSALISFIGQNYGAKKFDRIGETFKIASLVMLCYGAFVTFILAALGKYIFWLFLPDPVLMERSILYFWILAVCQIPMCLEAVSTNSFRGMGNTLQPAVINTSCNILRVLFVYILSMEIFGIGLPGVWIGISVSACIKGIWSFTWYLFKKRSNVNRLS